MEGWLRKYNYISDYYYTSREMYAKHHTGAYPVTYYMVDWENSTFDKDLMGGSYEKYGVGSLSGMLWKKIQMLPIYFTESVQPMLSADERGITMYDSEFTGVVLPSEYGILPSEWDFVHFSQDYMTSGSDFTPIFVVKNIEKDTWGNICFFKSSLNVAPNNLLPLLEQQISTQHMFLEFTKKIHEIQAASLLLKLQQKNSLLIDRMNNLFHTTGFYMEES